MSMRRPQLSLVYQCSVWSVLVDVVIASARHRMIHPRRWQISGSLEGITPYDRIDLYFLRPNQEVHQDSEI